MTQTLATDANGDIYVGSDAALAVAVGVDAVRFALLQAARTLFRELVLAYDQGIPYRETVWSGVPNIPQFEAALRRRLLAVADVTGIVALETRRTGDVLGYTATIRTIYGPVSING